MGTPVEDAKTMIYFPETGLFRVWVRTRDWAAPWKKEVEVKDKIYQSPGIFKLLISGQALETVFGIDRADWHWQYGNEVKITKKENELCLRDLTGFDGRCDAIIFTKDPELIIPDNGQELTSFRRKLLGHPEKPKFAGNFDFVVVGGGIAGICASVSAARKKKIQPYSIPFRCLYSRNINNLMMAGRNISVTHVALGTVRVMKTIGMMGEVAGLAASLCKKFDLSPRKIYQKHLKELKKLLQQGVPERSRLI